MSSGVLKSPSQILKIITVFSNQPTANNTLKGGEITRQKCLIVAKKSLKSVKIKNIAFFRKPLGLSDELTEMLELLFATKKLT